MKRATAAVGAKAVPLALLVAEDSETDRMLLQAAFDELEYDVDLRFVTDGEELLDYLCRRNVYVDPARSPTPALILLDLNMPRMNGLTALRILRGDTTWRGMPVIVLSTSSNPSHIAQAYAHGSNAFLSKPECIDDMIDVLNRFGGFWLRGASLPDLSIMTDLPIKTDGA